MTQPIDLNLLEAGLVNGTVVEASAGTGKTYSVSSIVARELACDESLRMNNILVTTFTRNAAAELRDRIRRRIAGLERQLHEESIDDGDELAQWLFDRAEAPEMAARLSRALREFDTSTISTIHSVCSRILSMAGIEIGGGEAEVDVAAIMTEVVNDVIITEKAAGFDWDVKKFVKVVEEYLRAPKSVLDFVGSESPDAGTDHSDTVDDATDDTADGDPARLRKLKAAVETAVEGVRARTRHNPSFDDILLRTAEVLEGSAFDDVRAAFRERFRIAIVDEAQDTDALQWTIFKAVFAPDEVDRQFVAVGDPKQAIYRFRGADVESYVAARDPHKIQTLRRNYRSDARLIDAFNHLLHERTFGKDISYIPVLPGPKAPQTAVRGVPPFTVVDIGDVTNQLRLVTPAARRVRQLLDIVEIEEKQVFRKVRPRDVCVLVASKKIGQLIESDLRKLGVIAVSTGTGNVMDGAMALDFRRLFEAMDRPHLDSSIRLAAATTFFGDSLADAGLIDDVGLEQVRSTILDWSAVLRRHGVASLAFTLRADEGVLSRLVSGAEGERHETDFAHIVELLHAETGGGGCGPAHVLEACDVLAGKNFLSETVSRRVESDKDAVQVMTVHAAKGLEFPVVVVADLWKLDTTLRDAATFHRENPAEGTSERVIDIGVVDGTPMDDTQRQEEVKAEKLRLFYVAVTRAKHHVSLLVSRPPAKRSEKDKRATDGLIERARDEVGRDLVEVVRADQLPVLPDYEVPAASTETLTTAKGPDAGVVRSYQRMSFSSITSAVKGRVAHRDDAAEPPVSPDNDDSDPILSARTKPADDKTPFGVASMPLARLVGGTYIGTVLHKVYEHVDFASPDLEAEVARVVTRHVTGSSLRRKRDDIIEGVVASLRTPLGGALGDLTLSTVGRDRRLDELKFEMTLARVDAARTVSSIADTLREFLPENDPFRPYADRLSIPDFNVALFGLMNGSIDALLNVGDDATPRLFVTDYKSNRLDEQTDTELINGYSRPRLVRAMEHHDYPLQALIYGAGIYRYLRWRRPDLDADAAIGGIAYFFIRGMVGVDTPVVDGHRHGVFTWTAPSGLWARLSELLAGVPA